MNKVILIGNVGRDPEIRQTTNGKSVATVSVATSERWKNKTGERQEETEWHTVEAWDKTAEIIERYVHKGDRIAVEGTIRTDKWADKETGEARYRVKIRCLRLELLGGKGEKREAPGTPDDSDIPF